MSKFTKFARRLREGLFPPKLKAGKTRRYLCVGGPVAGHELFLTSPRTLPFSLYGQRGYYLPHPENRDQLVWKEIENDL